MGGVGGGAEKEGRSSVKEALCKIKLSFSLNVCSSLLFECFVLLNMCEQSIRGEKKRKEEAKKKEKKEKKVDRCMNLRKINVYEKASYILVLLLFYREYIRG